ncbi:DUF6257 family protein [Streptomyces sp. NPDC048663]|uniref:DUF6257 family protein n=1 Tax=Streptomyces sp. NPDC048663 TaxID=3155638 RepID=UPI00343D8B81
MAAPDVDFGDFTLGEKVRIAGLVARMAKRGNADTDDLKRRIERIENTALRRKTKGR